MPRHLFIITSLLSAFLLFLVQPMVGKAFLPWFGGASLVWTTCLMFFQLLVLLGYGYAHLVVTRWSAKGQVVVHGAVLVAGAVLAHILPSPDLAPTGETQPTLYLLSLLARHVGFPFFALSATAPLVQSWYYRALPGRSPYPLYAVSNAGSLAALLSYPFVVEPLLPLPGQETAWFVGFIGFAVCCAACGLLQLRQPAPPVGTDASETDEETPVESDAGFWTWAAYAACGSVLLLTTTDQLSQDLAASPLFWVMPLSLYLVSFIICFARKPLYQRAFWTIVLLPAMALLAVQRICGAAWPVTVQLLTLGVTLFVGCMVCHGELSRLRPAPGQLTRFYLALSLGGALGGVVVAVAAPLLFPGLWEFGLGWLAVSSLVLVRWYRETRRTFSEPRSNRRLAVLSIAWLLSAVIFVTDVVVDARGATRVYRNFYGRLAVTQTRLKTCLFHGDIQHGCEWRDPERAAEPTTYYGVDSGVGVAVRALRFEKQVLPRALQIGVVGLGVGTSAAWATAGDTIRFYELNPLVVRLAETAFSYLSGTDAAVEIVVGDARLSLAREADEGGHPRFDLLVLDAFSGDAIPLHLLTREAFRVYQRRLSKDGVLAIHVSNQHVRLEPLVLGLATDAGLWVRFIENQNDAENLVYASSWVLVSGNASLLDEIDRKNESAPWPDEHGPPLLFTDRFSNLLELL